MEKQKLDTETFASDLILLPGFFRWFLRFFPQPWHLISLPEFVTVAVSYVSSRSPQCQKASEKNLYKALIWEQKNYMPSAVVIYVVSNHNKVLFSKTKTQEAYHPSTLLL